MQTPREKLAYGYTTIALVTPYWRPGEDYAKQIIKALEGKVENGDIVTLSEKAISTALGNIIDESTVKPSPLAKLLAKYWMRVAWGYGLGRVCHLKKKTIWRFKTYPVDEGAKHKQVALERAGFMQAFMHGSEGGIDGSNLPYSFVSIPLRTAPQVAGQIQEAIQTQLGRRVVIMIIDTDRTYSFRNFHFAPRPGAMAGIKSGGGFFAYLLGRFFKLRKRATPIALSSSDLNVEEALQIAQKSNSTRGFGAGRNVWDMADTLGVSITGVTWEMLDRVEHKPIVIVRRE